ncbi:sporulation histidine kinase inhibitor Sda [Neobacillus mesonae]
MPNDKDFIHLLKQELIKRNLFIE